MIKICPNCKINFKSANKRKIYCSDKCQRVYYRKSPAGKAAARKWNKNIKKQKIGKYVIKDIEMVKLLKKHIKDTKKVKKVKKS